MKKFLFAALAVATVALVGCEKKQPVDDPTNKPSGDSIVTPPTGDDAIPSFTANAGEYVIVVNFEGPICEGAKIAFPNASYADESSNWLTDLEGLTYMEEVTTDAKGVDFSGQNWYKVTIAYGDSLKGKPVIVPEGAAAFDWNYQTGDVASWTVLEGEALVTPGYSDEADVCYPTPGVYVLKSAYWKKQVNPCDITLYASVKFTLNVPAGTDLSVGEPKIHGANPLDWGGLEMTKVSEGVYTYEATDVPDGTEFQFTLGGDWNLKAIWEDAEYNCTAANFSVTGANMEIYPTVFAAGCPEE